MDGKTITGRNSLAGLNPPPFAPQKNGTWDPKKKTKPKSMRTLHAEIIREKIAQFTASKIDNILQAMEQSATGNTIVWQDTKDGRFERSLPPSVEAAKLFIEHTSGKPTQPVEMKAVVGIVDLVKQLESNDT